MYAFITTTAQLFPFWIPVLVEQHLAVDEPREWGEFPIPSVEQIFVETMQEVLWSKHCESKPVTGRKSDQLASQKNDFIQLSHCLKVSHPPPTFFYQKNFYTDLWKICSVLCGDFGQIMLRKSKDFSKQLLTVLLTFCPLLHLILVFIWYCSKLWKS